jgi:hypothetical protein
LQHARILARIRLTRTAAERGPVLSGACGQDAMAEINRLPGCWSAPTHTRPQARVRMGAWSVDTGRSQRGVQSDVSRDGGERR